MPKINVTFAFNGNAELEVPEVGSVEDYEKSVGEIVLEHIKENSIQFSDLTFEIWDEEEVNDDTSGVEERGYEEVPE